MLLYLTPYNSILIGYKSVTYDKKVRYFLIVCASVENAPYEDTWRCFLMCISYPPYLIWFK